jgi:hypothetical protein
MFMYSFTSTQPLVQTKRPTYVHDMTHPNSTHTHHACLPEPNQNPHAHILCHMCIYTCIHIHVLQQTARLDTIRQPDPNLNPHARILCYTPKQPLTPHHACVPTRTRTRTRMQTFCYYVPGSASPRAPARTATGNRARSARGGRWSRPSSWRGGAGRGRCMAASIVDG